jgi:DNA-directed RNA polymerase specialized sigma24 family protein
VNTYHVVVTREGVNWLADVPAVPGAHTWARNLVALDGAVREAIALADDLPDDAEAGLDLVWDYRTGDAAVDAASATLRAERTRVAAAENAVAAQTRTLVSRLVGQGYSVRDTARLAGIAPQRVSQLMRETTQQDPLRQAG